ncbi:hypothetical protein OJ998_29455 [Solirubrobacter taibaiensis]|nr:hypothetical protein [Solirubrobacter taibaiensis]
MTSEETRLRELLTLGGVTGAADPGPQPADELDPIRVWSVWQQFAAEHEGELRAFVDGHEVGLSHAGVRTAFRYEAELDAWEATSDGTSLPEFFAEVLTHPSFQLDDPLTLRIDSDV